MKSNSDNIADRQNVERVGAVTKPQRGSVMNTVRRVGRFIHRDLSFLMAGVLLIYAVSGLVMNHRDTINPNYSVEVCEFTANLPQRDAITRADVEKMLAQVDEDAVYTKHYFPSRDIMKVFIKGGSTIEVNLTDNRGVYEHLTRRAVISSLVKLHYNPGSWWTTFSDIFAVSLIIIVLSGLILVRGKRGLIGRGGAELLIGIAIPVLFLLLS